MTTVKVTGQGKIKKEKRSELQWQWAHFQKSQLNKIKATNMLCHVNVTTKAPSFCLRVNKHLVSTLISIGLYVYCKQYRLQMTKKKIKCEKKIVCTLLAVMLPLTSSKFQTTSKSCTCVSDGL